LDGWKHGGSKKAEYIIGTKNDSLKLIMYVSILSKALGVASGFF